MGLPAERGLPLCIAAQMEILHPFQFPNSAFSAFGFSPRTSEWLDAFFKALRSTIAFLKEP